MNFQQLLWQRWGDPNHPAEWDGRHGNGGKGSQRFWEYLWAIDKAWNLTAVLSYPPYLLDVGSGETRFFPKLFVESWRCEMVDPAIGTPTIEEFAKHRNSDAEFNVVTCISVLEHVSDKTKFCEALDSFDAPIVMTFEFGPGGIEQKEMYKAFGAFKRHYIATMELCPVWADNSTPDNWRPMGVVLQPIQ